MDVFLSSSFSSELYRNSKSHFTNQLPELKVEKPVIEIKSILLDNRLSILRKFEEPFCVVRTDKLKKRKANNAFYIENVEEVITFPQKAISLTLSITDHSKKKLFMSSVIEIQETKYKSLTFFTQAVNLELRRHRSDINLGFNKQDSRFYFESIPIEPDHLLTVTLSPLTAYTLGFSRKEKKKSLNFYSKYTIRKAVFRPSFKKLFYNIVSIRNSEAEDITDLCELMNHVLGAVVDSSERVLTIKDGSSIVIEERKRSDIKFYFNSVFLDSISKRESIRGKYRDLLFIGLDSKYMRVKEGSLIHVNRSHNPKLLKLFCKQLHYSTSLTSSAIGLLKLIPFDTKDFYKHTIECPSFLSLHLPRVNKLEFYITDEKNRVIEFSTGAPTFLHCNISSQISKNMHKLCHFNSKDSISLKYFPNNTNSHFTQKFVATLDTRFEEHFASLQSIYIPYGVHNINSIYTHFSVFSLNNSVEEKQKMSIPDGCYTRESFIEELNKQVAEDLLEFRLIGKKLQITNMNAFEVFIRLSSQLSYLLGYTNNVEEDFFEVRLPANSVFDMMYTFKFSSLTTRYIKVIANILSSSLMGQSYEKILRVINLDDPSEKSEKEESKGWFINFPSNHWVKVEPNIYNSIVISLNDENNIPIVFSSDTESVEGVFTIETRDTTRVLKTGDLS